MIVDGADCVFRLLGPVQVEVSGQQISFSRRQHIDLLGYLLFHHDRVVTMEQLVDAMWGETAPRSARSQIKNMASSLRKALTFGGKPLAGVRWQSAGYRLFILTGQLDLTVFSSLAAQARKADEPADALRLQRAALDLWSGEHALTGVRAPFAAAVRAHLEERRNAMREALFDMELSLGNHAGIISDLTDAVAAHPSREPLVAQLMTALYRSGRAVEALAVYQRSRQTLIEDYGLEPGQALRDLERMILAGEPGLSGPGPRQPIVVREDPPPRAAPAQLPMAVRGFVGRDSEMAALDALIADAARERTEPVVGVIVGTAGVGKTTLAVHWAHQVSRLFPDGQLYLNLRGFDPNGPAMSTGEAIRLLLDSLSVPPGKVPAGLDAQTALYRTLIAGKRMLVLLDNALNTEQVSPLLPGTPGSAAIVTSREQLTGLIATWGAVPVTLDVLDEADARQLFVARLGLRRVAEEEAAVAGIARYCARLPLALSLAAARAAARPRFSLTTLCLELAEAHGSLKSLSNGDARVDVDSVFSWSYQRVSGTAAKLFRLLSLHPGPDIDTAAAASLAGWSLQDTATGMSELAHAHLIAEHLPGRFTIHDLLRAYASQRSGSDDPEQERILARHRMLDHYLHTAYAAALMLYPHRLSLSLPPVRPSVVPLGFTDHQYALAWFKAEHQVLIGAVEIAAGHGLSQHTWQLASAISTYLSRCGPWHDWVAVQALAVKVTCGSGDRMGEAHARRALGLAYNRLRQPADAIMHLHRSFDLQQQLEDPLEQAYTHLCICTTYESLGDNRNGLAHAEAAFDLYAMAGSRMGQAQSSNSMGWFHAELGNCLEAIKHCERSVELYRELGDRQGMAQALDSLGFAWYRMGDYEQAANAYRHAVLELRAADAQHHEAIPLTHLGEAYHAAGQEESARQAWQEALDILDRLDHPDAAKVRTWLNRTECSS